MSEPCDIATADALCAAYVDSELKSGRLQTRTDQTPKEDLAVFFRCLGAKRRVLDIGCGWGNYVNEFIDAECEYFGIDHSREAIRLARTNCDHGHFILANLREPPFLDATFDGLWSCCSYGTIPKKYLPEVLARQRRLLMPGGCFYIIMPDFPASFENLGVSNSGMSMWYAGYEIDEFCDVLVAADFKDFEVIRRPEHGTMSFISSNTP